MNNKETKEANRILDNIIKRILMTPTTTPREVLYMETGILDIEHLAIKSRINMQTRLQKSSNWLIDTALQRTEKNHWAHQTKEDMDQLEIKTETTYQKKSKHTYGYLPRPPDPLRNPLTTSFVFQTNNNV